MKEYEEEEFDPGRRNFLKLAATVLGLSACSKPDTSSQTGQHPIWTAPYWYPLSDRVAKRTNTPYLHSEHGPLHTFDKIFRNITGRSSDARGWAENFAQESIKNHPDWEDWMGYCPGLANTIALEKEPLGDTRTVEEVLVDRADRIGMLAALHVSDAAYYYSEDKEMVNRLVKYFVETGRRIVVNIPDGQEGRWFRAVYGVSHEGRFVNTTDVNKGYKTFLTSAIRSAYIPYRGPGADRKFLALNENWRNPHLEGELAGKVIRYIAYNEKM